MKTCNDAPVGYTDHPMMDIWQGWNGGSCPVHPLATVEYVMKKADGVYTDTADQLIWENGRDDWDIIAYRLVQEYKAPEQDKIAREVWLQEDDFGWIEVTSSDLDAILFREVLE